MRRDSQHRIELKIFHVYNSQLCEKNGCEEHLYIAVKFHQRPSRPFSAAEPSQKASKGRKRRCTIRDVGDNVTVNNKGAS